MSLSCEPVLSGVAPVPGQSKTVGQHLFLQRGIFRAQPGDLVFKHRAIVRHRLAGEADRALAANRYLAGLGVEPQEIRRRLY